MRRVALGAVGLVLTGQLVPAATAITPLRRTVLPGLSGISGKRHVALTYDDGPDQRSTPAFLDLLDRHEVTATFFLLGAYVWPHRRLVVEMVARGHELAVHGWDHQCLAWKRPGRIAPELRRAKSMIEETSGTPARWYRPPYGVLTTEGWLAARRAGLRTVLWSTWGVDWTRGATPESVVQAVRGGLVESGTVLLHDTDRTAVPGSWRTTLAASERLLGDWTRDEVNVGPLRDHFS